MTLLEVERDGGWTRLVPVTVELLADGDDLVLDRHRRPVPAAPRRA